jgi:RNA polymerase sigma-70 factor, ECF subfamily
MRPLTQEQLVLALRADDPDAPTLLWSRYAPAVRRLLTRALGPSREIEDVTQEVFLQVFVRLPTLRDPSALAAFVFAVAVNILRWEIRRRQKIRRMVCLSVTGALPDVESSSVDTEAREALRRCYCILDSLPSTERQAFALRYVEEMKIVDVAASLAVSESTAKRWANRGAAKIARQVAGDPDLRSFFAGQSNQRA